MGCPVSAGSGTAASRRDGLPIWSSWVATSKPESGCGQFGRGPTRTSTDWKNSSRSTHSEATFRRDGVCWDQWRPLSWYGLAGVGHLGHSYNDSSTKTPW